MLLCVFTFTLIKYTRLQGLIKTRLPALNLSQLYDSICSRFFYNLFAHPVAQHISEDNIILLHIQQGQHAEGKGGKTEPLF